MGGRVIQRMTSETDFLVASDASRDRVEFARSHGIPCLSTLWIDALLTSEEIIPIDLFIIKESYVHKDQKCSVQFDIEETDDDDSTDDSTEQPKAVASRTYDIENSDDDDMSDLLEMLDVNIKELTMTNIIHQIKEFDISEAIINIDKKSVKGIAARIKQSIDMVPYYTGAILHAIKIRPQKTKYLIQLLEKVNKEYTASVINVSKDNDPRIDIIMNDDIEKFVEIDLNTIFNISLPYFDLIQNIQHVNLSQLVAYYGAYKCFNYLVQMDAFDLKNIAPFVLAGGSYDIYTKCKEKNVYFRPFLNIAVIYQRNIIFRDIIQSCDESIFAIGDAIYWYNNALAWTFKEKFNNKQIKHDLLLKAVLRGNIDFIKNLKKCVGLDDIGPYELNEILIGAIQENQISVLRYFNQINKLDVTIKDLKERTLLYYVVLLNRLEMLHFLFKRHVLNVSEGQIIELLDVAHSENHTNILNYFYKYRLHPKLSKLPHFNSAIKKYCIKKVESAVNELHSSTVTIETDQSLQPTMPPLKRVFYDNRDDLIAASTDPERQNLSQIKKESKLCKNNMDAVAAAQLVKYLRSVTKITNFDELNVLTGMEHGTLYRWFNKAQLDKKWFPYTNSYKGNAMTDALDNCIFYHIYTNYISKNLFFNDQMCAIIALAFWKQCPQEHLTKTFKASSTWIKDFKKRHKISSRSYCIHKRPKHDAHNYFRAKYFFNNTYTIVKNKEKNALHRVINIDESCWRLFDIGSKTWAIIGSHDVQFQSEVDEKDSITIMGAISADLKKLPMCVIKKGKSNNTLDIISETREKAQFIIGPSKWSTELTMVKYLIWLRSYINDQDAANKIEPNQLIDLILDVYPAHLDDNVISVALDLNIMIHTIPAGCTDVFQPLDRFVFGSLKSMARRLWLHHYLIDPEFCKSMDNAIDVLLRCWNALPQSTLEKAWEPYISEDEPDFDKMYKRDKEVELQDPEYTLDPNILKEMIEDTFKFTDDDPEPRELYTNDKIDYKIWDVSEDNISDFTKTLEPYIEQEKTLCKESKKTFSKIVEYEGQKIFLPSLLYVLSMLPNMSKKIADYLYGNPFPASNIRVIHQLLSKYIDNCWVIICNDEEHTQYSTFTEALTDICSKVEYSHGIIKETGEQGTNQRVCTQIFEISNNKQIAEELEAYIDVANFWLGSFVIIKFANTEEKNIQNGIEFREYTLVLKTIIVTDDVKDCYVYNRIAFTNSFLQVKGKRARSVKFNKMLEDEECMTYALYIPVMKSVTKNMLIPPPLTQDILTQAGNSPTGTITHYNKRTLNSVYPRVLISFVKDEKNKNTEVDSNKPKKKIVISSTNAFEKCILLSYNIDDPNYEKKEIPKNKTISKKKSPVWPKEKSLICKSFVTLLKRQPIASYINAVLQLLINMQPFIEAITLSEVDFPLIALLKQLRKYSYFDAAEIYSILREEYDVLERNSIIEFTNAFLENLSQENTLKEMIDSNLKLKYKEYEINMKKKTELSSYESLFITLDAHTSKDTLSEMIEEYFSKHDINEGGENYKLYRIEEVPEFLMIYINRVHLFYDRDRIYHWKINRRIEFTNTLKIQNEGTVFKYNLYGLVSHHGYSIEDDNYVTYIKNGSEWYEFNNEELSVVSDSVAIKANYPNAIGKKNGTAAIMFVYQKTNVKRKEEKTNRRINRRS